MLIRSYITTQLIQIIHFNEITQYTNMITVEVYYSATLLYISKGDQDLQIQILNTIVADLQKQMYNLSSSNPPPDDMIPKLVMREFK